MNKVILKKFAIESRQDLMNKISNKIKTFYVDEEFKKEQKGEVFLLYNEKHSLSLTKEENDKRDLLIKRIKELTLEQVIEEAAYTWFNRIIAIRYMEINDMLPLTKNNSSLGIRVLSSKDNTPDPEILKFTNLINPELDIDFKKEKYIELKDDNEKFKYVLLLICKKLGKVIPQVFDGITDYIDILIPDNLLNESGFVRKVITEVPEYNYNQVEIIGWLYQYYNQTEKDRVMATKEAYKKNEIAYATQLFTPDWIVKYMVENSLGKYWVENSSQNVPEVWKYYIEENIKEQTNTLKPTDITVIDPCCGSGHILVYAFEVLFQIYSSSGYNKNDIPEMIIKNNLFGLDIDDRAGQLSILSVLLKAREYDKNIFNKDIVKNINILSIQESNNFNELLLYEFDESDKDKIIKLFDIFKDAKVKGSLIFVPKEDYSSIEEAIINNETIWGIELKRQVLPIIRVANILMAKYDIVITNPPYLTNKNMDSVLQKYVNKFYENSKRDLFSCFIEKCEDMTKDNCYFSLITIHTWMFLSAFKNVRKNLINNNTIKSMVHLGAGVFQEINTFNVLATSFVAQKSKPDNSIGIYIRLVDYADIEDKISNFFNKSNYYYCEQKELSTIQDNMFLYYLSKKMLYILGNSSNIGNTFRIKPGLTTSNNSLFVRNWYEISKNKIGFDCMSREDSILSGKKWFPYNNGGNYRKWYGNNESVVNWEKDGEAIRQYKLSIQQQKKGFNVGIAALNDIFKSGLTYSIFGFRNFGIRYKQNGFLFDVSGASIFTENDDIYYLLGYLASNVSFAFLSAIAPTVNFQAGDISCIPYIYNSEYKDEIDKLVKNNIVFSKEDWDSFETSWDFTTHPLIEYKEENGYEVDMNKWQYKLKDSFLSWEKNCEEKFKTLKNNEEKLNEIFINIYELYDEIDKNIDDNDITIRKADRNREIKSLISYAVGCMFGRYSLDEDGLVYAGGKFDSSKYKTFKADDDNIIPITDESYFNDDIVNRFKQFIEVVYGKETLNENLDYIAETLGKKGTETSEDTIRRYFVNDFYNDHIKIYQKRPIYWLFDSGKKNGFKCLIYMHRYSKDLVASIRTKYIPKVQTTYEKLLSDVEYRLSTELSLNDKKEMEKKKIELNGKIQEVKEYYEKIANVANRMIDIDLDDGVVTNYAKFTYLNPKTNKEESILGKIK